jgi:hypothetical protein
MNWFDGDTEDATFNDLMPIQTPVLKTTHTLNLPTRKLLIKQDASMGVYIINEDRGTVLGDG